MPRSATTPSADQQPLVSVIVPVYNGQALLGEALSSVMRQTWGNLEIVVIDDGSTDRSAELARLYQQMEVPGRTVVVIEQENTGVAAARNTALRRASGEFLTMLDADDALLPGAISRLMAERERLGGGRILVSAQGGEVTPGGLSTSRPLYREPLPEPARQREVILQFNIGQLTSIIPRAFFEEVGYFDETADHVEDWDLWLRAVYSGWRFHRVEEVLWLMWWTAGSLTSHVEAMGEGEDRALRHLLRDFRDEMTPQEVSFVEHRLERGSPQRHIRASNEALRAGDLDEARRLLLLAAELMPAQKRVVRKAQIARVPGGMQVLARRQAQTDRMIAYDPSLGR